MKYDIGLMHARLKYSLNPGASEVKKSNPTFLCQKGELSRILMYRYIVVCLL